MTAKQNTAIVPIAGAAISSLLIGAGATVVCFGLPLRILLLVVSSICGTAIGATTYYLMRSKSETKQGDLIRITMGLSTTITVGVIVLWRFVYTFLTFFMYF